MDEKQNKRKNRSDDDRQNPVFLMVHKTVENNHFYCGLLLLMFMSIVTGYGSQISSPANSNNTSSRKCKNLL